MAVETWVQATLFEEPNAAAKAPRRRRPRPVAGRVRSRPTSHIHVTSDPQVAQSWDLSHRLSAELTWQLARSLSEERLEELRRIVGRSPQRSPSP